MASFSARKRNSIHRRLFAWYRREGRSLPWRRTRDPYRILVSEIMLQQTQVSRVVPKYRKFLRRFPTVRHLARARRSSVIKAWHGMGYNRRALYLQQAARAVAQEHAGRFPSDPATLQQLPGIGPYTARAVACFAFEKNVACRDVNIDRVLTRVTGVRRPHTPQKLQALADTMLAPQAYEWHQALFDLGATVCTARTPACSVCPLNRSCVAYQSGAIARQAKRTVRRAHPTALPDRYYRGRIVSLLRTLKPGAVLAARTVGPAVKESFTPVDRMWLTGLIQGLATDGLVHAEERRGELHLSLPR